jgi:hypothetical protein
VTALLLPAAGRLGELEATIAAGRAAVEAGARQARQGFVQIGGALAVIREERLYVADFGTFDRYCRARWGFTRQRAHQLIAAAQSARVLTQVDTDTDLPANERQVRELQRAGDGWADLWAALVEVHGAGVPVSVIRAAADAYTDGEGGSSRGLGVHFSSDSAEWYTTPDILDAVADVLGGIDLDPCSNSHEAPNVPATRHFTAADDGLVQPWAGTVYLNPPYGQTIGAWVAKLRDEYAAGRTSAAIALVPARTDTQWFQVLCDFPVCFFVGRVRFNGHVNSAPFPTAAFYLGSDRARFAERFTAFGNTYALVARTRRPGWDAWGNEVPAEGGAA